MTAPHKTTLPTIAGILIIISASILLAINLITVSLVLLDPGVYTSHILIFATFLARIAIILCIGVVGLVGGIMSLMRRQFVLALICTSFILLTGINAVTADIGMLGDDYDNFDNFLASLMILVGDAAVFVFSFVSIVLLSKSRNEFS